MRNCTSWPAGTVAQPILVGSSLAAAPEETEAQLRSLRDAVPAAVPILVGGAAQPIHVAGVTWIDDLSAFEAWLARGRETATAA